MIKLRCRSPEGEILAEKSVTRFPLLVGRSSSCALAVPENSVSSQHVELSWDGTVLTVRDLGSSNGTFLDDMRVVEVQVSLPCSLRLATNVFLEVEEISAEAPAEEEKKKVDLVLDPTLLAAVQAAEIVKPSGRPDNAADSSKLIAPPPRALTITAPLRALTITAPPRALTITAAPPPPLQDSDAEPELPLRRGLDFFWVWLQIVPSARFSSFVITLTSLHFTLGATLCREPIPVAALNAAVALLTSLLAGSICAAILALGGYAFRGEYDIKPLFLQLTSIIFINMIYQGSLRGLGLVEAFLYPVHIVGVAVLVAGSLSTSYVLHFNTFPKRTGRRILLSAMLMASLQIFAGLRGVLAIDREALAKDSLLNPRFQGRRLASHSPDVKALTKELSEVEQDHGPQSRPASPMM